MDHTVSTSIMQFPKFGRYLHELTTVQALADERDNPNLKKFQYFG